MKVTESEISMSTPLIFYEIAEGTKEEKEELIVSY
jgi:hypothetical protein